MFSNWNNEEYACGEAAFPHLWIAGAVFAVGMGIAFWDGRVFRIRRLLAVVGLAVVLTLLINAAGLIAAGGMGGE